jgi:hypothetical protein
MEKKMIDTIIHYAPVVVVMLAVLLKGKFFTTPEQVDTKIKNVTDKWEDKYLTIVAFREFQQRISEHFGSHEKRLDEVIQQNGKILDILMKRYSNDN